MRLTIVFCVLSFVIDAFALPATKGSKRTYYIRAETIVWDYAPIISTNLLGERINVQTVYNRTLYKGYTDATYKIPVETSASHGDLGPVIRAEVGDTITVHFHNGANFPVTMHPHGVQYEQVHEGMMIPIHPGNSTVYIWNALPRSGPTEGANSTLWAYHSHVHESDIYHGLIGPIVIYAQGQMDKAGNELFLKSIIDIVRDDDDEGNKESATSTTELFSINGYIYGNLPLITLPFGQKVTWFLFSFGDEADIHAMHWHGNVVRTDRNKFVDVVHLFPASFETVVMIPDTIGHFMYHCHTLEHYEMGMYSFYNVSIVL